MIFKRGQESSVLQEGKKNPLDNFQGGRFNVRITGNTVSWNHDSYGYRCSKYNINGVITSGELKDAEISLEIQSGNAQELAELVVGSMQEGPFSVWPSGLEDSFRKAECVGIVTATLYWGKELQIEAKLILDPLEYKDFIQTACRGNKVYFQLWISTLGDIYQRDEEYSTRTCLIRAIEGSTYSKNE